MTCICSEGRKKSFQVNYTQISTCVSLKLPHWFRLLRCCCLPAHVAGGEHRDDRAVVAVDSPISPILTALVR